MIGNTDKMMYNSVMSRPEKETTRSQTGGRGAMPRKPRSGIANITTYLVLRDWCSASDKTCDPHAHAAATLRTLNLASGVGLLATYLFGVYDGVVEYRRQTVVPFVNPVNDGGVVGIAGSF